MRLLVVSDIHGNAPALAACATAAARRFDRCLCLGDVVGYGANPNECVAWVAAQATAAIRGNHERACLDADLARNFHPLARAAIVWTCSHLTATSRLWLEALPTGPLTVEGVQIAHGSPRDEDEYVTDPLQAAAALAAGSAPLICIGHTHLQGGFAVRAAAAGTLALPAGEPWPTVDGRGVRRTLPLAAGTRYLLNPGSVGQPRDGDPRAAFLMLDLAARQAEFYRLPYDIAAAQERILGADLPPRLAERLALGR